MTLESSSFYVCRHCYNKWITMDMIPGYCSRCKIMVVPRRLDISKNAFGK